MAKSISQKHICISKNKHTVKNEKKNHQRVIAKLKMNKTRIQLNSKNHSSYIGIKTT